MEFLIELVGEEVAKQLQEARIAIVSGGSRPSKLTIATCHERSQRGRYHEGIRRVFKGTFETRVDGETSEIIAMPAVGAGKPRNSRASQKSRGSDGRGRNSGTAIFPGDVVHTKADKSQGKYIHFTMFKENKDTMEAISYLARLLKIKNSSFGFAGTKDRRAATTQRVSVFSHGPENMHWVNARSKFVKIGDFQRNTSAIQLGQHGGNDFVIVVKGVELVRGKGCSLAHRLRMTEMCVQSAMDHIQQHGFINYFGLQRFGTRAIGTQEIGQKILGLDFQGACEAILDIEPETAAALELPDAEANLQPDEYNRARAIQMFQKTGESDAALEIMPRRFSAETTLLQHLGRKNGPSNDYCGALCRIPRGLRVLYIHAYQSLVWNWATSERWSRHGDKVIAGDLVLVEQDTGRGRDGQDPDAVEALGADDEPFYQTARTLSAEEAASGKYSIFDIVLPVPGYDILYPANDIGEFYSEFMGRPENGGLSPHQMRRPQKEFSLSGHYRKIMARFTATPQFFVRPYSHDFEQMHPTDVDDIRAANLEKAKAAGGADEDATNSRRRRISQIEGAATADGDSKRVKTDAATAAASVEVQGEPMVVDTSTSAEKTEPAAAEIVVPENTHVTNLFKTLPTQGVSNDGKTAINRTSAWRDGFPDFKENEEMEIAVALNFRMSSSNYATMCLREMMTNL